MGEYMYSCSDFLMTLDTPQTFKALKIPCVWGFFWTIEHYPNTTGCPRSNFPKRIGCSFKTVHS